MDIESVRSFLPSFTRQQLGVSVSIIPMADGKMDLMPDQSRPIQVAVNGRFDLAPELEALGGGAERRHAAAINSPHATISFALKDLQYNPKQNDRVSWLDPSSSSRLFRIDRVLEPVTGVCLCYLSELK